MAQFIYRLQPLLEQKEEARREAGMELSRREQELDTQTAALRSSEQHEKELVEKLKQLRRELLGHSGESNVLSAKEVVKRVDDAKAVVAHIEDAKKDVESQRLIVEQCQARIEQAKQRVQETRREVEVLAKHRARQQERFQRALIAQEELALDEIGNVLHATRRRSL